MALKRSPSPSPQNPKRVSMGELFTARQTRLQMLSLVPDDVLRMVAEYVPLDVEGMANLLTIGPPFCDRVVMTSDSHPALMRVLTSGDSPTVLRNLMTLARACVYEFDRHFVADHFFEAICASDYSDSDSDSDNMRAMVSAALHHQAPNYELGGVHSETLVYRVVANGPIEVFSAPEGVDAVAALIRFKLWDIITKLVTLYDVTIWHHHFRALSADMPQDTLDAMCRRVNLLSVQGILRNAVVDGDMRLVQTMCRCHLGDIDGDNFMSLFSANNLGCIIADVIKSADGLAYVLREVETSVDQRSRICALAMLGDEANAITAAMDDGLITVDRVSLVRHLLNRGSVKAVPILAKLHTPEDIAEATRMYTPTGQNGVRGLVAVLDKCDKKSRARMCQHGLFLDRALAAPRDMSVNDFKWLRANGAEPRNPTRCLLSLLRGGYAHLATALLRDSCAKDVAHDAVLREMLSLHHPGADATVMPLLYAGHLDHQQLRNALSRQRRHHSTHQKLLLNQVELHTSGSVECLRPMW